MKAIFAAAALLVTMTACGGSKQNQALDGTTWKLTKMAGIPAEAIAAEADNFTLMFTAADMTVAGRTNCNRFFGKYELEGRREIDIETMGMTRMACPDMQYEDIFVKSLDDVDRYKIQGSELTLLDDKRVVAVFKSIVLEQPAQ